MATDASISIGLSNGSAVPAAAQALQRTREQYSTAMRAMKSAAYSAGRSLAQASSANTPTVQGRDASSVKRTFHARDAYHARVKAESEKYRAAYLSMAVKSRENSLAAVQAARVAVGKARGSLVDRALWESQKADVMERSAARVEDARQHMGEPSVVSAAQARRVAADAGVTFSDPSDSMAISSSGSNIFTKGPSAVALLIPEFFPQETRNAASGLGAIGDPGSWADDVKRALGIGVNSIGESAVVAGQEESKNNPAAGALVSGIGGALKSIGGALGLQFDAGVRGDAPPADSSIGVGTVVAGVVVLGGLYLIWRSA